MIVMWTKNFFGAPRSGARQAARSKRFAVGKTLMPAEFISAEQMRSEGSPAGASPLGSYITGRFG